MRAPEEVPTDMLCEDKYTSKSKHNVSCMYGSKHFCQPFEQFVDFRLSYTRIQMWSTLNNCNLLRLLVFMKWERKNLSESNLRISLFRLHDKIFWSRLLTKAKRIQRTSGSSVQKVRNFEVNIRTTNCY
ncbi:pectin methylesterase inhibitor 1 [Striga asiatica]|uniref:Pectin methylesterase inhibitor 1 n=1 Tax=Striga asiatica TaxID=4170 RepID=A0A5A7PMP9_STRAF|nr:pectin methylesterase inhibitor 1 [Striga asiatica]